MKNKCLMIVALLFTYYHSLAQQPKSKRITEETIKFTPSKIVSDEKTEEDLPPSTTNDDTTYVDFPKEDDAGSQLKGTLYRSDHWADIKGNVDWALAMDYPTYEKSEVLITINYIKVTLGNKIYSYKIVSSKQTAPIVRSDTVTLNNKTSEITLFQIIATKAYSIANADWEIPSITDITTVPVRK